MRSHLLSSLLPVCCAFCFALLITSSAFSPPSAFSQEKQDKTATKPKTSQPKVATKPKQPLPAVFGKKIPASIKELQAIEKQVQAIEKKISAATVGIRIGRASGSGVIVSEDGYILTAAHVCGTPGRKLIVIFPDGKKVQGISLGLHRGYDAGMMKITEEGKYPFLKMANYDNVKTGDWCVAMGHPGGFKKDRPPVLRLGRVIRKRRELLQSDCVIVGGDSGGPLFDMHGDVIGINSRIGPALSWNFHAPVSAYVKHWDEMVANEIIGGKKKAILGVNGEKHPAGTRVTAAPKGYPAAKAGIQIGDIITKFGGKKPNGIDDLAKQVKKKNVGEQIEVEILRGDEMIKLKIKLEARE